MKTVNVAEAVKNFSAVLVRLESEHEEILLMRDDLPVARLVPEPEGQDAMAVFADLHDTLDEATADDLLRGVAESRSGGKDTLNQLRNPWDS